MRHQVDKCVHGRIIEAQCLDCERETTYGCGRIVEVPDAPRVITRVMDDGVETKDGAA